MLHLIALIYSKPLELKSQLQGIHREKGCGGHIYPINKVSNAMGQITENERYNIIINIASMHDNTIIMDNEFSAPEIPLHSQSVYYYAAERKFYFIPSEGTSL